MGLIDWMERTTARLDAFSARQIEDAEMTLLRATGRPVSLSRRSRTGRWPTPDKDVDGFLDNHRALIDTQRGEKRTLDEEDINGFLAASGQAPEPRGTDADEFVRRLRHSPDGKRLRRAERDREWLRREARLAGVLPDELEELL